MQNIIVFLIIALCAFFVGRRLRRSLDKSRKGCGCGCDCSGCGPELTSLCHPAEKPDPSR